MVAPRSTAARHVVKVVYAYLYESSEKKNTVIPALYGHITGSEPKSLNCKDMLKYLLLLHCCLLISARSSLNDDLLSPYQPHAKHGPSHSYRHVRDCQPVIHGNRTHEEWPSSNSTWMPVATTRIFESKFPTTSGMKTAYGHFTYVNNPLRTFSVLEPGGPGGCSKKLTATVEETIKHGNCFVAQNGGYFDMDTGNCFGNIVSDGKLVQSAKGIQNAQFGIKSDGTLIFGYLSEEQVLEAENPFVQLLSGVVWLLRNGEVYINQSKAAECDKTQTTGDFDHFINVISARTAIGHDREGRLILFHVDGQTDDRGLNLWELANFLKDQGVINAINLDGGGSATLVINGTLANYPSDHCHYNPMWRCPRSISTVVCVHEPFCDPPDCSGHGQCILGECQCTDFWTGPACSVLSCGPLNCSAHGNCTEGGCVCDQGWIGADCNISCVHGYYGEGCRRKCPCQNNSTCNHVDGSCQCSDGYTGLYCEEECPLGFYGAGCQHACHCKNQCYCDHLTGSCNITKKPSLNELSSKVGQCMETLLCTSLKNTRHSETAVNIFAQWKWVISTCTLALLLVISAAFNMKQVLQSRGRHIDSKYSYHQLQEVNGNMEVNGMLDPWDAN